MRSLHSGCRLYRDGGAKGGERERERERGRGEWGSEEMKCIGFISAGHGDQKEMESILFAPTDTYTFISLTAHYH